MAIQSQPSRIPEPFAGSGTKNTIPATNATPSASQAASWASGFPPECSQPISAGGCPVPRNDVNGALNQLSQDFAFRQDGGIWAWSALADYDTQRMVRGSNGLLYWSVAQSGPNTAAGAVDPTADNGTYWTAVPLDNADVVHVSGVESVNGLKYFNNGVVRQGSLEPHVTVKVTSLDKSQQATTGIGSFLVASNDWQYDPETDTLTENGALAAFGYTRQSNGSFVFIRSYPFSDSSKDYASVNLDRDNLSFFTNKSTVTLGKSSNRWGQIYSTSSTISTSDGRLKTAPEPLPDAVLDAWGEVGFVQFQMLDSVAKKGADARLHSGLVAQRIDAAFKSHGLDARRYGLFCWDEWGAVPEERDEQGAVVQEARPAGDLYSLRYEEALCMEAAYQRRRADRAEARLAALEERLAAIEAKLG